MIAEPADEYEERRRDQGHPWRDRWGTLHARIPTGAPSPPAPAPPPEALTAPAPPERGPGPETPTRNTRGAKGGAVTRERPQKTDGGLLQFENPDAALFYVRTAELVLLSKQVSSQGKILYQLLLIAARRKGHAYPGQRRLAAIMKISERQLQRYQEEIEDVGLIEVTRPNMNLHNNYLIKAVSPLLPHLYHEGENGEKE